MKKSASTIKFVLVLLVLAVLIYIGLKFDTQALLKSSLDWVQKNGALGAAVFIAIYIICTVLFVPGSVLTLGAGAVFGVVKGSIFVSIASTLGAAGAFLIGRYLARDWISKKIEGNKKFKAIDEAVAKEGWKIVGLTRLSPAFPFTLLNYAYGLTRVSLRDYFLASWIGMIPGTVMYVYLGSAAGEGIKAAAGENTSSPGEMALKIVGLIATIIVTVFVTKIAKKALNQKVSES